MTWLWFILMVRIVRGSKDDIIHLPPYPDDGNVENRIIGGIAVSVENRPYQVHLAVYFDFEYSFRIDTLCGGVIYNRQYILTAAHCFYNTSGAGATHTFATVGKTHLHLQDPQQLQYEVEEVIIHDEYDPQTSSYDIAILRLRTCLNYNNFIQKISITEAHPEEFVGTLPASISGWGILDKSYRNMLMGRIPSTLQYAEVTYVPIVECRDIYANFNISDVYPPGTDPADFRPLPSVPANDLCVTSTPADACAGDSGGPLVCEYPDQPFALCGIISGGIGCNLGLPNLCIDAHKLKDWIQSETTGPDQLPCAEGVGPSPIIDAGGNRSPHVSKS